MIVECTEQNVKKNLCSFLHIRVILKLLAFTSAYNLSPFILNLQFTAACYKAMFIHLRRLYFLGLKECVEE